jgi:hypothetical protein
MPPPSSCLYLSGDPDLLRQKVGTTQRERLGGSHHHLFYHLPPRRETRIAHVTQGRPNHRLPQRIAVDDARYARRLLSVAQLIADGKTGQVGIAGDGAALPVAPVTPDPALKPDAARRSNKAAA